MLQYLLNCSAIWLLSLLCYDIFLRRSTFHQYNRFYLLLSLFAGVIIPLISLATEQSLPPSNLINATIVKSIQIKEEIVNVGFSAPKKSIDWWYWIKSIYIGGCLISAAIFVLELFKILIIYKNSRPFTFQQVAVLATRKDHAPFSFFGMIFISSKKNYSHDQLSMIVAHEKRHNTLLHSMDIVVVNLFKIAFWFHPLCYIFQNRLQMLHEYQADGVVERPIAEYGTFLLEQSLLTKAPHISNSFNRSPLKNRIVMLTRKSSTWSKSKIFIAIPVVGISLLCFSKNAFSDNKRIQKGNKVTFNGSEFELKVFPIQKSITTNTETGKSDTLEFEIVPYPIKINNLALLNTDSVDEKPKAEKAIHDYLKDLFEQNTSLFSQLEDGNYDIDLMHFVTGEKGEVLYYKFDGIRNRQNIQLPGTDKWVQQDVLPANVKSELENLVEKLALSIKFTPAIKNGKPVTCFTEYATGAPFIFSVTNHKAAIGDFSIPAGTYKVIHQGANDSIEVLDVSFLK